MPSSYTGTKEERLAKLEIRGQRCDGSFRCCTQTAVRRYTLIAANPATGEAREGAQPEVKQACSKHRRGYGDNANYKVLSDEVIAPRVTKPEERRKGAERTMRMRALIGCTFVPAQGEPERTVTRVKYVVDDVRLTGDDGQDYMLRDVFHLDAPADDQVRTSADDDQDEVESARRVDVPLAVQFSN